MGLVVACFITLAVVIVVIRVEAPRHTGEDLEIFARDSTVAFGAALVGGLLLAALNGHPHRNAFIVPYAATGTLGCLLWLRFFLVGPAEWLLRTVSYGTAPAFLRTSPVSGAAAQV